MISREIKSMQNKHVAAPQICHAYKVYYPDVFGGIPLIIRLLTKLRNSNWKSEIVVTTEQGTRSRRVVDGTPVYVSRAWWNLWSMPLAPFYPLLLWRRTRQCDIIDYHFPFPLVDLALLLYMPRRARLIVHWHSEIVAQKNISPYLSWLFFRTLRRADRVVVSYHSLIDESPFLRKVAHKCVVIPFGIDTNFWATLSENEQRRAEDIRRRYPKLVVSVGRLVPYKGFDVLIEAMVKVEGHLLLAGTGHLRDELAQRIRALGLENRVHLMGHLDDNELKSLLHASDVFVLPSITPNETFGLVQLEAMAAGKPIVNTRLPTGVPWVARDGQEALTVTPKSAEELAYAITRLLDDSALARQLGGRGKTRALTEFHVDHFVRDVETLYNTVLAERDAPAVCL